MKNVLIIGGTGTLGRALIRPLLKSGAQSVLIFSRDELKQKQLAREWADEPRVRFRLGDVRDAESVMRAMQSVDTVFHVAALKHIDVVEDNPEEGFYTNVMGTVSVADAAEAMGVQTVVFSSTDKAVDPINSYGFCKALSERILLRRNATQTTTRYKVYRWGNVVGSRGSVIPEFAKALKETGKLQVTDRGMTRFWLTIDDAVDFMMRTFESYPGDEVLIPPLKAASLLRVIKVLARIVGVSSYTIEVVGMRAGEKMHEVLASQHSGAVMESSSYDQYSDHELEGLIAFALNQGVA